MDYKFAYLFEKLDYFRKAVIRGRMIQMNPNLSLKGIDISCAIDTLRSLELEKHEEYEEDEIPLILSRKRLVKKMQVLYNRKYGSKTEYEVVLEGYKKMLSRGSTGSRYYSVFLEALGINEEFVKSCYLEYSALDACEIYEKLSPSNKEKIMHMVENPEEEIPLANCDGVEEEDPLDRLLDDIEKFDSFSDAGDTIKEPKKSSYILRPVIKEWAVVFDDLVLLIRKRKVPEKFRKRRNLQNPETLNFKIIYDIPSFWEDYNKSCGNKLKMLQIPYSFSEFFVKILLGNL